MENTQVVETGTRARAQELLGSGIAANLVAQTLGVSESYVSQLLSEDEFLKGVVALRYENLSRHNKRDQEYDALEDKALAMLKETLPMVFDPMKLSRIIQTLNSAHRRGQSAPDSITQQNTIVNLTMPTVIVDRHAAAHAVITKDANNQVIEAGGQTLVTIQGNSLLERVKKSAVPALENTNAHPQQTRGNIDGVENAASR